MHARKTNSTGMGRPIAVINGVTTKNKILQGALLADKGRIRPTKTTYTKKNKDLKPDFPNGIDK